MLSNTLERFSGVRLGSGNTQRETDERAHTQLYNDIRDVESKIALVREINFQITNIVQHMSDNNQYIHTHHL